MRTLIFISEPKSAKKVARIASKAAGSGADSAVLVSLNDHASNALKKCKVSFKTASDILTEKEARSMTSDSIWWLRQWSDKSGIKGITYRNISLWYFFDFWLYYSFFRWDVVKPLVGYVNIISLAIKKTKPDRVIAFCSKPFAEIIRQIEPKADIRVYDDLQHIKPYLIDIGVNAKHCIRKYAALLLGPKPGRNKGIASRPKILFTTYTSWFRDCLREDGSTGKEDAILGYVIRDAMKRYDVKVADIDYTTSLGLGLMKEMARKKENIPFEYYLTGKISRLAKKESRMIFRQWKELRDSGDDCRDGSRFRRSFHYKGIDMYPLLRPWLDFVFRKRVYSIIRYIEAAISMIDQEDPRLVFVVDETALFGRCMIAAAKSRELPVVAIQHGYITPDSFEYLHPKGEISNDMDIKKPYCPIADRTFVYGPYTKEILTKKSSYPEHSIVVTGQPRYDCLGRDRMKRIFHRQKVFDEFRLDRKKKLILWTTQDVKSHAEIVFNAVKGIPEAQLLVKLHPRVLIGADFYYKKAREAGIKIKAVREANTFELIYACDAMITMHSTTGLEAIMMGKPVVVLNISGMPDMVPYVQEGAAIGVYRPEELQAALRQALFDRKKTAILLKKSREYTFRHSYKMDGMATERVMQSVNEILKKRAD